MTGPSWSRRHRLLRLRAVVLASNAYVSQAWVSEAGHTATSSVPFTNGFNYYVMRGPAIELRTSAGTSTGGTASGDISNAGPGVSLCRGSTGDPELAEVIMVKGTLSDANAARLVAYFKKRFAL